MASCYELLSKTIAAEAKTEEAIDWARRGAAIIIRLRNLKVELLLLSVATIIRSIEGSCNISLRQTQSLLLHLAPRLEEVKAVELIAQLEGPENQKAQLTLEQYLKLAFSLSSRPIWNLEAATSDQERLLAGVMLMAPIKTQEDFRLETPEAIPIEELDAAITSYYVSIGATEVRRTDLGGFDVTSPDGSYHLYYSWYPDRILVTVFDQDSW